MQFPEIIFSLLSCSLIYALIVERTALKPIHIFIDEDGVKNPASTRSKLIAWWEIEESVFNFGTFTVNCLDNRFYQWNITSFEGSKEEIESFWLSKDEVAKMIKNGKIINIHALASWCLYENKE